MKTNEPRTRDGQIKNIDKDESNLLLPEKNSEILVYIVERMKDFINKIKFFFFTFSLSFTRHYLELSYWDSHKMTNFT